MSPLPSLHWSAASAMMGCLALVGSVAAQTPEARPSDPVIELPEFTITESPVLPDPEAWSYAQIPGFEVLSSASDRETRRLLRDFEIFRQALGLVWPVPQRATSAASIILCGRGDRFPQFMPAGRAPSDIGTASLFLRNREQVAIIINLVGTLNLVDLDAAGTAAGASSIPDFEVDAYKQLYREYVHFVLSQGESRPPPWLAEGLAQIIMDMEFTDRWVTFGEINSRGQASATGLGLGLDDEPAEDDDAGFTTATVIDRQFNVALSRRALIPLDQMFAVTSDSPEARNPLGNNRWAKQCYAFVHLCLYGEGKRYQKPFAQFLQRIGQGPATEAAFQECFGMDYRKMLEQLRAYIGFTRHEYQRFVLKGGERFSAPPPEVQPASEAQIGRIKGDALRLGGHRGAAHQTYRAAYIRGQREPRLLAALGVEEVNAGRADRGRKLLEAAAQAGFDRPSAYVELARLRFAEVSAAPAGAGGKLAPAQVAFAMAPLISAQRRQPPVPETFALAAAVWLEAEVTPTRDQLRALDHGITLFPHFGGLIYQAAVLNQRAGDNAHAATLARHGLQVATDEATRARFQGLLDELPAATDSPPTRP